MAASLRELGFGETKPLKGGPSERAFQGGLGTKKVDVSYADEQHGLLLAISIKTIGFPPFEKNLKNRFSDLLTEAITLHMRFPYSPVSAFFAFPVAADEDVTRARKVSTFMRAARLLSLASGRKEYTDPAEKFENIAALAYRPSTKRGTGPEIVKLIDCTTLLTITEEEYFELLRRIYNKRNPHLPIGKEFPEEI